MVADGLRGQLNIQSFVTGQAEIDLDFQPGTPARLYNRVAGLPEIPTLPGQLQVLARPDHQPCRCTTWRWTRSHLRWSRCRC